MSEGRWQRVVDLAARIDLVPPQVASQASGTVATWHGNDPDTVSRASRLAAADRRALRALR